MKHCSIAWHGQHNVKEGLDFSVVKKVLSDPAQLEEILLVLNEAVA